MEKEQHLQNLADIKNLMERSTRFISLSGLSGVSAGVIALIGAWFANTRIKDYQQAKEYLTDAPGFVIGYMIMSELFLIAIVVFVLALISAYFFTNRRAKKNDVSIWNATSKKLLINLLIPIATGGAFCLLLLYHSDARFIAPSCLLFYGLALVNASKYTLTDIRYLGIAEIVLGLVSMFFIGQGLLFWAIGFGIFHIIYGTIMYLKNER